MIQHIDIIPVDLEKGLVRDNIGYILATGDKRGNRIGVEVRQGGVPKELSRCTATGYFIRPTGQTVVIPGTVEGSTAYVDLPDTCYVAEGPFALAIKVASGSEEIGTLRVVDGYVRSTQTDAIIDPGTVIPSLSDLLAQIAVMEQAISDANAATRSAQEAAQAANTANQTVQDALVRGDYDVKALQILGYYPDLPTLQSTVTRPKVGDVYAVGASAPYAIYVYSATGWVNNGVLQGPAGQGIPTGGTTGQLLQKRSGNDYDTTWATIPEPDYPVTSVNGMTGAVTIPERMPTGGTAGQVLTKASAADYAVGWETPVPAFAQLYSGAISKDTPVSIGAALQKYHVFAVNFNVAGSYGFGIRVGNTIKLNAGFASNTVYGMAATLQVSGDSITLTSATLASPTYVGETTIVDLWGVC